MTIKSSQGYEGFNLVGLIIEGAYRVPNDRDFLYFKLKDGRCVEFESEGSCCATCYICHINCSDALANAEVLRVENLEEHGIQDGDYSYTDVWGHRIVTTKGICTIDMRTEHNGNYSGWLNAKCVDALPAGVVPLEDF